MPKSLSKEKLNNILDTITPKSLFLIQKIGEYKGKQILYENQQPEYLDKLQINAMIENTTASNSIDGLIISKKNFMELFEGGKEPKGNIQTEIIRYIKVLNLINNHYENLEITPDLILQFHRNLFRYKPDQGGRWKPLDNIIEKINPDGTSRVAFVPVTAEKTPEYINDLCYSYKSLIEEGEIVDLLVIAAFILDFLCIHPFTTGNGRVSRLLTQLLLYQQDYKLVKYVSLDKIILDNKSKYFYNLNKSSQDWHNTEHILSNWIEFFLWSVYLSYAKLDKQIFNIRNKKGAKSQQVKFVIDSLPETFKIADIVDKCQGISRPTINKVLQEMRDENTLKPCSMGRDALWQKLF